MARVMRRSDLPMFVLGLLAVLPSGCAVPTPADVDDTETEGSSGFQPEGTTTTNDTDEDSSSSGDPSSSTTEEPATSTGPAAVCGDGSVDADEACDDGNDEDADGCNRDCTASGSLLWTHEFPLGIEPAHLVVDAEDRIHVVARADAQVFHFVLETDGAIGLPIELNVPVDMPPDATDLDRSIDGFGLSAEGAPILSVTDAFFADGEFLSATYRLVSEDPAWVHTPEESGIFYFDVTDEGRIVGMGGDGFFDISPSGEMLATGPSLSARIVAADDSGAALAGRDLAFYDLRGNSAWMAPWPSGVLRGLSAVDRFPNGDVIASGQAGENLLEAAQVRLARYTADGTELSTWLWPDEPSDETGPGYNALAVTPAGHIAFPGFHQEERFLWKLDENYETRWKVDLPDDLFLFEMASDSTGALVFLAEGSVGKFAP